MCICLYSILFYSKMFDNINQVNTNVHITLLKVVFCIYTHYSTPLHFQPCNSHTLSLCTPHRYKKYSFRNLSLCQNIYYDKKISSQKNSFSFKRFFVLDTFATCKSSSSIASILSYLQLGNLISTYSSIFHCLFM